MNAATATVPALRSCIVDVKKVLVVEGSPQITERIIELVSIPGRVEVVATAVTEDEGLAACDTHELDVAVLELQLLAGTAFGVMRKIAAQKKAGERKTVVIVLTNHAVPALKVASFDAGADYFLDKSKDFATLPRLIGELLKGE